MMKSWLGRGLVAAAVLLALLVGYLVWERHDGIQLAQRMCEKDGGLKIYRTVQARGYLSEDGDDQCARCMYVLGRHEFEYVDALVGKDRIGLLRLSPGYYRYSRSRVGDVRCDVWKRKPEIRRILRQAGFADDECIAITPLSEAPGGYALRYTTTLPPRLQRLPAFLGFWPRVGLYEWSIEATETGEVLARYRYYSFISKLAAVLDDSGGGGNPDASCVGAVEYGLTGSELAKRVLGAGSEPSAVGL
jgi:hypothetical protein